MDGIASIIFKGKSIVKSVDLAQHVLYNEVMHALTYSHAKSKVYYITHIVLMQAMVLLLQKKYAPQYNATINAHILEEFPR